MGESLIVSNYINFLEAINNPLEKKISFINLKHHFSFCIAEAGCREGWIHEGLIFRGQHSTEDYHGEMNAKVFEKWVSVRSVLSVT